MIISFSRWVEQNKSFINIDSSVPLNNLSIRHYLRENNKRVPVVFGLQYEDSDVWSYNSISDNFLASFEILQNGIEIVKYNLGEDDFSKDFNTAVKQEQIPKDEIEHRTLTNKIYRLWSNYPWNNDTQKLSVNNVMPYGFNSGIFTFSINNSNLFVNAFNPEKIDREALNNKLINAMSLFEGDAGKSYLIESENKIVVPLSDGASTWTEEYDFSNWLEIDALFKAHLRVRVASEEFFPIKESDLEVKGKMNLSIGSTERYTEYRKEDVPTQFKSAVDIIDREIQVSYIRVLVWGISENIGNKDKNTYDYSFIQTKPNGMMFGWQTFPDVWRNRVDEEG